MNNFLKGIFSQNPTLKLLLGFCPTLAVTTSAINGLGMGLCTLGVLLCSNVVISLVARFIPDNVRIPCYIVIIASFVTVVDLLLQALVPELHKSLGIFIPLIVVNCLILGRAEAYANKNSVVNSLIDALGMGLGFSLVLTGLGIIRELLGSGSLFGISLNIENPITVFILPAGGFLTLGFTIALVNYISQKRKA